MSKATTKLKAIFKRLEDTLNEATRAENIRPVAEFVIDLVIKRTRLGYGVQKQFGSKYKFPSLSPNYVKFRKKYSGLSETTSPSKSNVTLTGQLLDSIKIIKQTKGSVSFAPSGVRRGTGLKNEDLALFLKEKGRVFLNISELEYAQMVRFYRKSFGDLLDKKRLLR